MSTEEPQTWTIDDILAELSRTEGGYPRAAIDAAIAQRAAITPRLITTVERAAAHPDQFDGSNLPFHAVMLLGHFTDPAAHPALLQLANMEDPGRLIGDALTENLPMILYRTADGAFDGIRRLIENDEADMFARSAGLHAFTYAVATGQLDRDQTLAYFARLLEDENADPEFLDCVISNMVDLYPGQWLGAIEAAFTSDRAAGILLDLDDVYRLGALNAEAAQAQLLSEMARYNMDDLHALLEGWAMYDGEAVRVNLEEELAAAEEELAAAKAIAAEMAQREQQRRAEAVQEAKRKQKRKQAKASRKKNRKR